MEVERERNALGQQHLVASKWSKVEEFAEFIEGENLPNRIGIKTLDTCSEKLERKGTDRLCTNFGYNCSKDSGEEIIQLKKEP